MSISLQCGCGKQLKVPDQHAGKKGKCPQCGQTVTVPLAACVAPVLPPPTAPPPLPAAVLQYASPNAPMGANTIIRQDKGGKNEHWQLSISDTLATLVGPGGHVFLQWPPELVAQFVTFPSFSKSIKYTVFTVAGSGQLQFDITGDALSNLRTFANRGIATAGPEAVKALLKTAILTTAGGVGLMCIGVVLAILTVTELNTGHSATGGNSHPAGFITVIIGMAMTGRGIYVFYHYSQVKKLQK